MNEAHPTFPNPTIQEALCEIHFRPPDERYRKGSLQGEFFKHIQPDFPELEPVARVPVQIQMGPSGVEQRFLPAQQRIRYKHATRNLLLQLSESVLTINELPKYPGRDKMSEDVLYAWQKLREVIEPENIGRIGLRYINRIERTHPEERAGDWLKPSVSLAEYALSSVSGFLYRLQSLPDPNNRLIVTLGEATEVSERSNKPIMLDIDRIVERTIDIHNDAIISEIIRLHDSVWDVFKASMTLRLERLLKGEEP